MNKNIASPILFIVLLLSCMSWKFFAGLGGGIYFATMYDMKPAVEYVKTVTLEKVEEAQEYLDTHKKQDKQDSFLEKVCKKCSDHPKNPRNRFLS